LSNHIIIPADEYVGVVVKGGVRRYFFNILSMWILDYASYYPDYDPLDPRFGGGEWRKGLLRVNSDNADAYIDALSNQEIPNNMLDAITSEYGGGVTITFIVNFDEKLFVNGWHDNIPLHEYVPSGWRGVEDDPYLYL
jgi:hypothetical protein